MPYAANGQVSQDPFPGCIEITQDQYVEAVTGITNGLAITVVNGVLVIAPPEQAGPSPEPDPTYQIDLAQINSTYQADVDKLLRAFSLAYLADGSSQDAKQAAIRAQYYDRKNQYSADLAALKAQYGV